jgi:DNA repair protein RecO (recombination protein O)
MLETAERFTPEEKEPAIRQFLLLIGGLRALGDAVEPGSDEATGEATGEDTGEDTRHDTGYDIASSTAHEPLRRDPRMVLDAYFLRSLTFAGYAPALDQCARCGSGEDAKPLVAFAVAAGGLFCADCRTPGAAHPAKETVALMRALLRGDWDEAMRSERRHRVECSGLVAAYLQWHLEHSIRSLRHVERA